MNRNFKIIVIGILCGGLSLSGFYYLLHKKHKVGNNNTNNEVVVIKSELDLKTYRQNVPTLAQFYIVNTGDKQIYLDTIIPDCDCYSAKADKLVVKHLDTLKIEAVYNKYTGPFLKKIHVYFKEYNMPFVLFFKGKVIDSLSQQKLN